MSRLTTEELVDYMDAEQASQVKAASHFGVTRMTVRTLLHQPGDHQKNHPPAPIAQQDVDVFNAILAHLKEFGWAPTVREAAARTGRSINPTHSSFHKLAAHGFIVMADGQPRALRVVGAKIDLKEAPNVRAHSS